MSFMSRICSAARSRVSSTPCLEKRPGGGCRPLRVEQLEPRQLLAVDLSDFLTVPNHNFAVPYDVNGDTRVGPIDALIVINALNRLPSDGGIGSGDSRFMDVNRDYFVSPLDALNVINCLNRPECVAAGSGDDLPGDDNSPQAVVVDEQSSAEGVRYRLLASGDLQRSENGKWQTLSQSVVKFAINSKDHIYELRRDRGLYTDGVLEQSNTRDFALTDRDELIKLSTSGRLSINKGFDAGRYDWIHLHQYGVTRFELAPNGVIYSLVVWSGDESLPVGAGQTYRHDLFRHARTPGGDNLYAPRLTPSWTNIDDFRITADGTYHALTLDGHFWRLPQGTGDWEYFDGTSAGWDVVPEGGVSSISGYLHDWIQLGRTSDDRIVGLNAAGDLFLANERILQGVQRFEVQRGRQLFALTFNGGLYLLRDEAEWHAQLDGVTKIRQDFDGTLYALRFDGLYRNGSRSWDDASDFDIAPNGVLYVLDDSNRLKAMADGDTQFHQVSASIAKFRIDPHGEAYTLRLDHQLGIDGASGWAGTKDFDFDRRGNLLWLGISGIFEQQTETGWDRWASDVKKFRQDSVGTVYALRSNGGLMRDGIHRWSNTADFEVGVNGTLFWLSNTGYFESLRIQAANWVSLNSDNQVSNFVLGGHDPDSANEVTYYHRRHDGRVYKNGQVIAAGVRHLRRNGNEIVLERIEGSIERLPDRGRLEEFVAAYVHSSGDGGGDVNFPGRGITNTNLSLSELAQNEGDRYAPKRVLSSVGAIVWNVRGIPGTDANRWARVGTGTILAYGGRRFILTAAHVVENDQGQPRGKHELAFFAQPNPTSQSGTAYEIERIYGRNDFNGQDIALLELKQSVADASGAYLGEISPPDAGSAPLQREVLMVGYGISEIPGRPNEFRTGVRSFGYAVTDFTVRASEVPYDPEMFPHPHQGTFLLHNTNTREAAFAQGDSGGPDFSIRTINGVAVPYVVGVHSLIRSTRTVAVCDPYHHCGRNGYQVPGRGQGWSQQITRGLRNQIENFIDSRVELVPAAQLSVKVLNDGDGSFAGPGEWYTTLSIDGHPLSPVSLQVSDEADFPYSIRTERIPINQRVRMIFGGHDSDAGEFLTGDDDPLPRADFAFSVDLSVLTQQNAFLVGRFQNGDTGYELFVRFGYSWKRR